MTCHVTTRRLLFRSLWGLYIVKRTLYDLFFSLFLVTSDGRVNKNGEGHIILVIEVCMHKHALNPGHTKDSFKCTWTNSYPNYSSRGRILVLRTCVNLRLTSAYVVKQSHLATQGLSKKLWEKKDLESVLK